MLVGRVVPSLLLALFLCRVPDTPSATWYVDNSSPLFGDGTSSKSLLRTIQEGIDAAADGDTVVVARGRYVERIDFKGKQITVTSIKPVASAVVAETIIDGDGVGPVVTFENGEGDRAALKRFTITGGWLEPGDPIESSGAGIRCQGASPTIEYNVIVGNWGGEWGGDLLREILGDGYGEPHHLQRQRTGNTRRLIRLVHWRYDLSQHHQGQPGDGHSVLAVGGHDDGQRDNRQPWCY